MTSLTCSIDGCERPIKYKRAALCQRHYYKVRKYGDPHAGGRHYDTPEESFAARTILDADTGCLVWTAGGNGVYGMISVGNGEEQLAHRYAWERTHGPIPEGYLPDHRCRNKRCVNVEHLRLATWQQNAQHAGGPRVHNTSGYLGVSFDKSRGKWLAYASLNKKLKNLGRYDTAEEAAEVSRLFRLENYTHNDHDRAA